MTPDSRNASLPICLTLDGIFTFIKLWHCQNTFSEIRSRLSGRKISLDFEPTQKINEIKETLQEKEGIPKEQIRLIYAGKVLPEESKIEEFKIQPGTVIMMMMHLKGGF